MRWMVGPTRERWKEGEVWLAADRERAQGGAQGAALTAFPFRRLAASVCGAGRAASARRARELACPLCSALRWFGSVPTRGAQCRVGCGWPAQPSDQETMSCDLLLSVA